MHSSEPGSEGGESSERAGLLCKSVSTCSRINLSTLLESIKAVGPEYFSLVRNNGLSNGVRYFFDSGMAEAAEAIERMKYVA